MSPREKFTLLQIKKLIYRWSLVCLIRRVANKIALEKELRAFAWSRQVSFFAFVLISRFRWCTLCPSLLVGLCAVRGAYFLCVLCDLWWSWSAWVWAVLQSAPILILREFRLFFPLDHCMCTFAGFCFLLFESFALNFDLRCWILLNRTR